MTKESKVRVFWRWGEYQDLNGVGYIKKYDNGCVTIQLSEEVRRYNKKDKTDDVWPPGSLITVPQKNTSTWDKNNCYEEIN